MTIIGRLTKNAIVDHLKDDRKVVNFTIAVNDYYKPKGSDKAVSITSYINCAYWINTTIADRLTKGSLIEISGRLPVNPYTGHDGEAKASLNCHADTIKVHQQYKRESVPAGATKEPEQDDLPF